MNAGLRRVGGAIFALLDHTTVVDGLPDFSSSVVDDGGGRSPYKPPSIFGLISDLGTLVL